MNDRGWLEPIVERVVGQVLDNQMAQLRKEIVQRVTEEVEAAPGVVTASGVGTDSADLARAVAEIQLGTSQREILRALLDACGRYAARVALFVVKGSQAAGWQGRGFGNSEGLKDFALDTGSSGVNRAIQDRVVVSAKAGEEMDARFLREFGAPENGEVRILPLVLKDKVAALVYADAGTDAAGKMDAGSVDLLVLATSAWLEVNSLRKQAHKEPAAEASESPRAAAVAVEPAPALSDPFAAHAPSHALAAAATATAVAQSPVIEAAPVAAPPEASVGEAAATAPSTATDDQETQRKAQRFARLLVDEIKLYNQAKVAEGRKNKDLYDRLKDAIEKSRETYQKRYGSTVAGSAKYFEDEVIRSLAEDDASIMGANFRR